MRHYMKFTFLLLTETIFNPYSKVRGANVGPIWGRQHPGGPHVGPMNFAIWEMTSIIYRMLLRQKAFDRYKRCGCPDG